MQMKISMSDKFTRSLESLPSPGIGSGFHTQILAVANYGIMSGMEEAEIFSHIKQKYESLERKRRVPDSEIWDAIRKASQDLQAQSRPMYKTDYKRKVEKNSVTKRLFAPAMDVMAVIRPHLGVTEQDIISRSPVNLGKVEPSMHDMLLLLTLFNSDDIIFIGDRYSTEVKTVDCWLDDLRLGLFPHMIPNPLTGEQGLCKDGKTLSYRADACVKDFRFAVVEHDKLSKVEQLAFWNAMIEDGFPVSAIIDSGGKSYHAWIPVNCKDASEWEREVEQNLYRNFFIPLGVDPSCKNEARLSRIPGHIRKETGNAQKLIYLGEKI
jgi:hypothetical protein